MPSGGCHGHSSRRLLRELVIQMFVIALVTQVFTYGLDLNGDHVMADDQIFIFISVFYLTREKLVAR